MISVVIPAYHEDTEVLQKCIDSVETAILYCPDEVEIYVAKDIQGVGAARNYGAAQTHGSILVFFDADCTMSHNFLREVHFKAEVWENVGGGTKWVKLDRYSLGRIFSLIPIGVKLYWHQVTVGAIWVRREYFTLLGGFKTQLLEDLDFVIRLRQLAKTTGKQFRSIKQSNIVWSTRSFDRYGEWFWVKKYRIFKEN